MDKKIVSLIASGTEIIWALGFGEQMVGRSHECDYPAGIATLPQVTWTKFDTNGRSYNIDERVKNIVQEGLSVYGVDASILRELAPDVIVTQDHCRVCAVSLGDVEEAVCQYLGSQPHIVSLSPNSISDIIDDIRKVAAALDAKDRGERLIENLQSRMATIARKAAHAELRPRVAFIEWIDPLMAGGNWVPELIEMAGGTNLLGTAGKHSPQMTFGQLRAADPDVVIIAPCGFNMKRTSAEMSVLTLLPDWGGLRAVNDSRIYIADGNQYFNRPGPRVVETLEICTEIIHPELFSFGHKENAWQRYQ